MTSIENWYRLIDRERGMTASGGGSGTLGDGENQQKGKRAHVHEQQCGDCWGERGVKGLNGNGKNVIKIKSMEKYNKD